MSARVSVLMPVYNQERFIDAALDGIRRQTRQPDQWIIVDDASTDGTFERVLAFFDKHPFSGELLVRQNPTNLGLIENFNFGNSLVTGDFVVYAAGDDISERERIKILTAGFEASQKRHYYVHSADIRITDEGPTGEIWRHNPAALHSAWRAGFAFGLTVGATQAYSIALFRRFGPIHDSWTEDLIMGFRAALMNAATYCETPLIQYRFNAGFHFSTLGSDPESELLRNRQWVGVLRMRARDAKTAGRPILATAIRVYLAWCALGHVLRARGLWRKRNQR